MTPRRPSRPEEADDQLSFDLDALPAQAAPGRRPAGGDPGYARGRSVVDRTGSRVSVVRAPAWPPGERSARRVAALLERPPPTDEQVAVIEAPADQPLLVVAGAGSGKTETMAARVVHLVANGAVRPDQVLGLTFTRKAAAELGDRVRARLSALTRRGLVLPAGPDAGDPGSAPAGGPDGGPDGGTGIGGTGIGGTAVTVSTYHAYSASIVADHGLRLGLDAGHRLISEAGAWQIVDDLVEGWDGDMSAVEAARVTVVDAVLALAGECAEHLVGVAEVEAVVEQLAEQAATLPAKPGGTAPGRPLAPVVAVLAKQRARRQILPIVVAYLRRKRELEVLDFGDQVALAARLATEVEEVARTERQRFRVVLLDEYQDTSHAQLSLLRRLFGGGHPVTAVGDPHQSIYGWRGASAGNLQRFPTEFPVHPPDGVPVPSRAVHLATSWRNDRAVLAAANAVSAPLRRRPTWLPSSADAARVDVPPLRERPDAGPGRLDLAWHATVEDEVAALAGQIETAWRAGRSAAVLCRVRSQFPGVEAALRGRGLPVEVVGLGGLLHVPEVADLRAALEVVHDAARGDSLMRLLTGAGHRIGPRDLDGLAAWARQMWRRPPGRGPGAAADAIRDTVDDLSLVEALDALPPQEWTGPAGELVSATGRERLRRLAEVLRRLRRSTALALPDLVAEVERALRLDVEVAAVPGRAPAAARANLDAFVDVAASFAERTGADPRGRAGAAGTGRSGAGGLGAFLAWLAAAEREERGLDAPLGAVRPDAVQLLTVHAAKGLEWDVVAVPGLAEGTFPNGTNGRPPGPTSAWLTDLGALPFPVRGDADSLPRWMVGSAGSQTELREALDLFREDCGEYLLSEERRLAYVAVTRARSVLLLSGAAWGDGSRPRTPSRFLVEVAELGASGPLTPAADDAGVEVTGWYEVGEGETNPREELRREVSWPQDPVADRRPALEEAARQVRAALAEPAGPAGLTGAGRTEDPEGWDAEVSALLAERDRRPGADRVVALPAHLSASRMVALARDPVELAAVLRRPMPRPPSPHARRGSAFHAWLEHRFGAAALVDVDELPGAADEGMSDLDEVGLARLQQNFLASPWARRTPDAVEVAVETPVVIGAGGAPVMLRGRIDAVFRADGGFGIDTGSRADAVRGGDGVAGTDGVVWEVVDWKTGAPPPGRADRAAAAVQLAVYRLAWSRLRRVAPEQVSAAFFYASTGETVRPVDLLDADGLTALVTQALASTAPEGTR